MRLCLSNKVEKMKILRLPHAKLFLFSIEKKKRENGIIKMTLKKKLDDGVLVFKIVFVCVAQ